MTVDRNPNKTAVREAGRRRRLGHRPAICKECGEDRLETLELHHPHGKNSSPDLMVVYCKNCHAVATEHQLRGDVPLQSAKSLLEREETQLRASAVFRRDEADAEDRRTKDLAEFRKHLDRLLPDWRDRLNERTKK